MLKSHPLIWAASTTGELGASTTKSRRNFGRKAHSQFRDARKIVQLSFELRLSLRRSPDSSASWDQMLLAGVPMLPTLSRWRSLHAKTQTLNIQRREAAWRQAFGGRGIAICMHKLLIFPLIAFGKRLLFHKCTRWVLFANCKISLIALSYESRNDAMISLD